MKKAFLIDGNSLAYRAFYALPDTMKNSAGLATNAIYGFTSMLLKLLEEKPDFAIIAFDRPEPTFRHKEYKEYKATRQKAPPTLYEQLPTIKEVASAFNLPIYELAGYEADDLIGTLARQATAAGLEVVIISGDLDPLQLVDERIKVLTTKKGITDTILYDSEKVAERYGLKPSQLIDYKALKGDTSDNIPGIPKIGEKTAVELLQTFGSLDNIYRHLEEIKKPALRKSLAENRELAELSRRLGRIELQAPVKADFKGEKWPGIDWEKATPLLQQLEFSSLIKKYSPQALPLFSLESRREAVAKLNYNLISDEKGLKNLLAELDQAPAFAFDLETTSLNPLQAEIVGISFSTRKGSAYYLPLGHVSNVEKKSPANEFLPAGRHGAAPFKAEAKINSRFGKSGTKNLFSSSAVALDRLKPFFLSNKIKIGHNLKYDISVLIQNGITVNGPVFDTMVAAYLLEPTAGKYSLKYLARKFLGKEMIEFSELVGEKKDHQNFAELPLDLAIDYAGSDADATFSLFEIFRKELSEKNLLDLSEKVEMPLVPILAKMETTGIKIDLPLLQTMTKELSATLKKLEKDLFCLAGEVFNLNSPKQLGKILFDKLQLPVIKKTKTGPSTDAEVLEELAARKFEIAEKLLAYRQLNKLKNTYVDVLPTLVNPKSGRLHSSFNQTSTATGRLSSSEPNLQNIPAKGVWGDKLRSAFIPGEPGWQLISADYSQVELRILAHLSGDPALLEAFRLNQDIHQSTADELGISRSFAKTINFGVIYGMSDFGLSKALGIKRTEAADYIERYFKRYPGIKKFIDRTIEEARKEGGVTTLLGRFRPLPDINSPNAGLRAAAERTAINTPVQGSAADLIKLAMVRLDHHFQAKKIPAQLLLQVHDELVFECPQAELEKTEKIIKTEMENALALKVHLRVDLRIGENWSGKN